ncbi:hypothetical protein JHK82_012579 [Glycine max]|nr:hypothetical protein JHK82_012579 [Glycine max]
MGPPLDRCLRILRGAPRGIRLCRRNILLQKLLHDILAQEARVNAGAYLLQRGDKVKKLSEEHVREIVHDAVEIEREFMCGGRGTMG